MGSSSDQIAREIADTRSEMEEKIIELRTRGEVVVDRSRRALVTGAIVGGVALAAITVGIIAWRVARPPTRRERIERLLPKRWLIRLGQLRESWELGMRRQVPPVRLFVGDRQIGEEPPSTQWQKIGMRFAQTLGSAVGAAAVSHFLARLQGVGRGGDNEADNPRKD